MVYVGIVWVLRAVVVLFCPAVLLLILLHPDWAVDAIGSGIPLVSGGAVILMVKIGPLHQCPGRHTTRSAMRAEIDNNSRQLRCYAELFRALGLNPSEHARKRELKRELKLLQGGGDTDPGWRAG